MERLFFRLGALFAFLLSWSNLPLSVFTTGADTTLPEWLFSRTATNYSPLVPAVAVIATLVLWSRSESHSGIRQ
mgnify:CR=1 FL=1